MKKISKPLSDEYAPFYAGYVEQLGEEEAISFLRNQLADTMRLFGTMDESKLDYAYAAGKWTIAELIGHVIDVERVMSYRILRFSRKDNTILPGFDQDLYVENGGHDSRSKGSLISEWNGLRKANLELIQGLSADQTLQTGTSSEVIFSVRALIYILGGHAKHHIEILKSHYLTNL